MTVDYNLDDNTQHLKFHVVYISELPRTVVPAMHNMRKVLNLFKYDSNDKEKIQAFKKSLTYNF